MTKCSQAKHTKTGLGVAAAAALLASLIPFTAVQAMGFEHVMSIGSKGSGEAQFKYVEDFALSADGHLLATDAAQ